MTEVFIVAPSVEAVHDEDAANIVSDDVAAEEQDILTRVENQQDDPQFQSCSNVAALNSVVTHTGIDDMQRFYNMSLHRCKKSMTNFLSAESDAEAKARLHLIAVAETVLDPRFDIQILSQIKSRSVTKAHRANPYGFLMQCVAPDRSRQWQAPDDWSSSYVVNRRILSWY